MGSVALGQLLEKLPAGTLHLHLQNINIKGSGKLNVACGADFVQKERTSPHSLLSSEASSR